MKQLLFIPLLLACFTNSPAQFGDFDFKRFLESTDQPRLREKARLYIAAHRGTPEALLLDAITDDNAAPALEKYKKLISQFPDTPQAELAQYKVGQFYFARGLYISARKHFLDLLETFPRSEFSDEAMYFAAACMFASKKFETSYTELTNFLKQFPRSPLARLAKEDLKELRNYSFDSARELKSRLVRQGGKFTVQIGAFSQINNALNLRDHFSRLGFPTEIREKEENKRTIYLVWIGAFKTAEEAEIFGAKLKKEHGKPYRIEERF